MSNVPVVPVKATPDQAAQRWVTGLQGAGDKIRQGVQAVTQAPGARAAARQDKYLNGVNANVGKWANRVRSVSLADWQQATIEKGVPRVASGAQASQGKFEQAMQAWWPTLTSVVQQVDAMDDSNLEARIAKSATLQRALAAAAARRNGGGG